jgi:hypothetical protein
MGKRMRFYPACLSVLKSGFQRPQPSLATAADFNGPMQPGFFKGQSN